MLYLANRNHWVADLHALTTSELAMFLTRIELLGFKSFADKTICTLGDGLTAIVGPNGCGKSNVVEAIRWVLGEQRPSALRGKAMGDVIFSGSSSLGPVSMAQVTLVFDNSRGTLPFDAPEVSVARRIYRDGESKYLLNMRSCMLREIKDVFYNSGLGAPEYAIMQREAIDVLLANRGSERRILIEEAAGIMRYRAHVKQSLSRLHNAEASILRLSDIAQERERLVRRLRAEAAQARRAKRYQQRMGELRRMIAAAAVRDLQSDAQPLHLALGEARRAMESHEARLRGLEAQVQAQRLALMERDQLIADRVAEQGLIRDEHASAVAAIALLDARDRDMERERQRLDAEIEEAIRRRDSAAAAMQAAEYATSELQRNLELVSKDSSGHEQTVAACDARVRLKREAESAARGSVADAERQLQTALHDVHTTQLLLKHALEAVDRCLNDAEAARVREEGASQQCTAIQSRLQALEVQLGESDQEIARLILRRDKANRLTLRAETASRESTLAQKEVAARRDLICSTIDAHEGFSEGARFLMTHQGPGLVGLLGEEVVPREGFERAVGAALAEAVDFVVVEHRDAARRLLGLLREAQAGRARIVERALAERRNGDPPSQTGGFEVVVGPVLNMVDAPPSFLPVVRALVGRSLLVRGLPSDGEMRALWDHGWEQLVTLEGDVLRSDGIHQSGASGQDAVLGRRHRLELMEELLLRRTRQARTRSARAAALRTHQTTLSSDVDALVAIRQRLTEERASLRGEMHSADEARRRAREAWSVLEDERTQHDAMARTRQEALAQAEADAASWAMRHQRAMDAWHQTQGELVAAQKEYDVAVGDRAPLRDRTAHLERELAAAAANAARHRLALETEERLIPSLRARLADLGDAVRQAKVDRGDRQERTLSAQERLERIAGVIETARQERASLAERVVALEASVAEARDQVHVEQARSHEAEVELARREARLQEVIAQASLSQGILMADLAAIEPSAPLADLEKELGDLQARSSALGDVNVRADEQYTAEAAELEKLQQELTDVRESRDELLRSIDRANRTARDRFSAAYERVNDHFAATFATLMPGGQARLELPGEGSMLTREIEIIVRPPGKRSRPIELLSGGERALTALAFLFGVYREKAGPLCILDEVDAPLDDANTSRFMDMLDALSANTQFIIVTHNKHTMARAVRLVGVTMEGGVSRLVPVELKNRPGQ
ncbi:chromosome segregation protein SMC [Candidatus Fermentibacteria bacterium]|nr:chromosome segregation protein SMC [Candidatus Fermentibacteria bacterium]